MVHDLALIALAAGDTSAASRFGEEAVEIARAHGFERLEAGAFGTIGYIRLEEGRLEDANESLRKALTGYVACGDLGRAAAIDLYAVAAVKALRGDLTSARLLVRAADRYFDELGAALEAHAIKARGLALDAGTEELRQREFATGNESEPVMGLAEAIEHARSLD